MEDNLRIDFRTAPVKCMQQTHTTCMGHSIYFSSALSNDPLPPKDGGFFKLGGSFKESHNILLPVEKFFKGCQQKIEVKITWAGLF